MAALAVAGGESRRWWVYLARRTRRAGPPQLAGDEEFLQALVEPLGRPGAGRSLRRPPGPGRPRRRLGPAAGALPAARRRCRAGSCRCCRRCQGACRRPARVPPGGVASAWPERTRRCRARSLSGCRPRRERVAAAPSAAAPSASARQQPPAQPQPQPQPRQGPGPKDRDGKRRRRRSSRSRSRSRERRGEPSRRERRRGRELSPSRDAQEVAPAASPSAVAPGSEGAGLVEQDHFAEAAPAWSEWGRARWMPPTGGRRGGARSLCMWTEAALPPAGTLPGPRRVMCFHVLQTVLLCRPAECILSYAPSKQRSCRSTLHKVCSST